jgi:hypothetical protein
MKLWICLIYVCLCPYARGGSTYSLPIPKPDNRPVSLAHSTPIDLQNSTVTVIGEFGGHVYHQSSVPLLKRTVDGRMDDTDQTISIGTTVKVLAFVRFRGNYYYRLESQGNSAEASYIDGRFLIVPGQSQQTKTKL